MDRYHRDTETQRRATGESAKRGGPAASWANFPRCPLCLCGPSPSRHRVMSGRLSQSSSISSAPWWLAVPMILVLMALGRDGLRLAQDASSRADLKSSTPQAVAQTSRPLGRRIENFVLRDGDGRPRSLDEFSQHRLVVAAFLGAECPLARLYARRLEQLRQEFGPRGVGFLALDANDQDSPADLAAFAREHEVGFPVLKDQGHRL